MSPLLLVAILGCTVRPRVSDTGYTGTWSRGNDRNVSIVAIVKEGNRYLFRWTKRSFDGRLEVRCGWDGRCEETLDGKQAATYEFTTRVDGTTGHLTLECREHRLQPEKRDFHFVDELVVESGGRVLRSYTIERNGQEFAGGGRPMRSLDKVSDGIAGAAPGAGR